MGLFRKDETGLLDFLKEAKEIEKRLNKFKSKKYVINIPEIKEFILDLEKLEEKGNKLVSKLNEKIISDPKKKKKYEFNLLIFNQKLNMLRELNVKMESYKKQLDDYEGIKE